MLKKYILRALTLAGLCVAAVTQPAQAQVGTYSFAASAGTYAALPATTTAAATVQTDDGISAVLPLGFSFVFDGTAYTQAVASSNGFLSFGPGVVPGPGNSLNAGAAGLRPLVAPLWDDLSGNSFDARASYQTTGTAPNRVFTFEWLNWKWNHLAPAVGISFQVQLFEGTNAVAFVYRPEAGALNAPTASIGLAGVGSGNGSYLSLLDTSGSPTASSTLENASLDTAPAAGQTYTFTPGTVVCTTPRALAVSTITGSNATLTFAGSATAVGYIVTYTPAGGATTTVSPNPTTSPVLLTGLVPGTTYAVTVASDCGGGAITSAATASFSTASYCVANLGGGGCAATDLISAVSIAGTTLNNTTNNCQTANGSSYSTFAGSGSTTATLSSGVGSYTLSVTSTANSASGFWIDYDQSNIFDDNEFTHIRNGRQANQAATVTFDIPATAMQGLTKLRIRTRTVTGGPGGSAIVAATDACTNFASGETEDYIITIGAPAACPAPTSLAASNPTTTSITLTFGGTAAGYTVSLTPQSGTAQTTTATASPVALTGLMPGTTYTVTVTANCTGGISSTPATLTFATLAVPPANNDCAAAVAVPVTTDCISPTSGTVLGATQSLPPGNNCGVPSQNAADVWFSFVATATSQLVTVTPAFNAIVDIRRGGCTNSVSVSCGVALAGTATSRVGSGLTVGATYLVRVYPAGTPPTAAAAGLTICVTAVPAPPANDDCAAAAALPITPDCTAPTAGTVAGATQSLAPTANCGGPALPNAFDVWYSFTATAATHVLTLAPRFNAVMDVRDGNCTASTSLSCTQVMTGTSASRLLTGLVAGTAYFVRVYPITLTAPSGPAAAFTLCLTDAPTLPANDDCAAAIAVPVTPDCSAPTTGTVAGATQSLAPTANCGRNVTTASDVWYSFVATAATHVVELAAQFNGIVDVRSGTCATSASLACNAVSPNNPRTLTLNNLAVGSTYFLRIYPAAGTPVGASATFQLCVTTVAVVPANNDPCGALSLLPGTGTAASTTAGATTTVLPGINPPTCSGANNPRDVWFSFVAPSSTMLMNFSGNSASVARLYTATTCSTGFNLFDCRRSANGVALGIQTINGLVIGTTYYVAVSGFANNSLTGAINVSFVVLGTRNQVDAEALLVYPNPSNTGQLTLRLVPQATAGTATLLNVLGQAVATLPLPAHTTETTLPVRGLAAGLYTLRVTMAGQVLTRKVVLE